MKKEFLPYELEVKLVELGFNEKTFDVHSDIITQGSNVIKKPTPRILFQQAFRFFREKYNIRGFITQKVAGDFGFEIYVPNKENPIGKPFNRIGEFTKHFKTFEEAQIACLKKLIEIAK